MVSFIRLDKKARLVLPLEIRNLVGVKPSEQVLIEVLEEGKSMVVRITKPSERAGGISYSKNGKYVGETYE